MRNMINILSMLIILGCNSGSGGAISIKDSSIQATESMDCDGSYDSLLIKYANEFVPATIDLNSSLSSDTRSFLLSVDTTCLRKQAAYSYFVVTVLGKLALHHLKCCNQHYDLYQMREGAAAVVINEFNHLAGYAGQRLEMLNSGVVADYVHNDKTLSANPKLRDLMRAIEVETVRIKKGV